jgi:hypothetical protein
MLPLEFRPKTEMLPIEIEVLARHSVAGQHRLVRTPTGPLPGSLAVFQPQLNQAVVIASQDEHKPIGSLAAPLV